MIYEDELWGWSEYPASKDEVRFVVAPDAGRLVLELTGSQGDVYGCVQSPANLSAKGYHPECVASLNTTHGEQAQVWEKTGPAVGVWAVQLNRIGDEGEVTYHLTVRQELPRGAEPPGLVPEPEFPPWPDVDEAVLRPGVHASTRPLGMCTTNFVFRSPDNGTLYFGGAAHCYLGPGSNVTFEGTDATGKVAYHGRFTGEDFPTFAAAFGHDFALLEVDDEFRHLVHPAVRHYGGPVGLAEAQEIQVMDRVLWYGQSESRMGVELLHSNEGYVCDRNETLQRFFVFYPVMPAIWGDSGSPVMLSDGRAAGVLNGLTENPNCGFANYSATLATALDEAAERGMVVELVTWELLEQGLLPDTPLV